ALRSGVPAAVFGAAGRPAAGAATVPAAGAAAGAWVVVVAVAGGTVGGGAAPLRRFRKMKVRMAIKISAAMAAYSRVRLLRPPSSTATTPRGATASIGGSGLGVKATGGGGVAGGAARPEGQEEGGGAAAAGSYRSTGSGSRTRWMNRARSVGPVDGETTASAVSSACFISPALWKRSL